MIRFTLKQVMDRPVEHVFEQLADINGYKEWMSREGLFRDSGQESEGPIEEGAMFYDHASFGRLRGTVTELDPPRRIAFRQVLRRDGKPIFESRPSYTLQPVGNGTSITHTAEGELMGMYKVLEPILYPFARAERRRVLDSLAKSLD